LPVLAVANNHRTIIDHSPGPDAVVLQAGTIRVGGCEGGRISHSEQYRRRGDAGNERAQEKRRGSFHFYFSETWPARIVLTANGEFGSHCWRGKKKGAVNRWSATP
jgi:hypothetical protein